jgi:glyoxylase-like metal-dependent hydrolase (beta-lactamase superfamily II)
MKITPIIGSTFSTDGGAMYGLVPWMIWSKLTPPDKMNRIAQNVNCLLVELDGGEVGLVETGCGHANLYSEKERKIYALSPGWPLAEALFRHGVSLDDMAFVVMTHAHWDHAGGAGTADDHGRRVSAFPNATHYLHTLEWQAATGGDPLLYKSYSARTIEPLRELGDRLVTIDDDDVPLPGVLEGAGIKLVRSSGHTHGHCAIIFEGDDIELNHPEADKVAGCTRFVYAGDICPTKHNLRLVFQTAYDTHPLDTRAWKRKWLPEIAKRGDVLLFNHDPDLVGVTLVMRGEERFEIGQWLSVHS